MIKKSLSIRVAVLGLSAAMLFCTPVMAATRSDADSGIQKTVTVTTDGSTVTEGMVTNPYGVGAHAISLRLLAYGPIYQYPAEGGIWQYGFWEEKVRSYYTVNRCHGSSVTLNGKTSRSIDTAPNRKSIAEKWAVQFPRMNDRYHYRVCD